MAKRLRSKTMTLDQLQQRVLKTIRQTVKQFNRLAHEPGLSDYEFINDALLPLKTEIEQDRDVIRLKRIGDC